MRPVRKGGSPKGNFSKYEEALPLLIRRISKGTSSAGKHLASYCSYCERCIPTSLAVEHIEPKGGVHGKPHLEKVWTNFLLACVNCNSTKGHKPVVFSSLFFPDRDNTFEAFEYKADGTVSVNQSLSLAEQKIAQDTLDLVGLQKLINQAQNSDIALERVNQRLQAWGQAESAKAKYLKYPASQVVIELILDNMVLTGFFSVWMTVFNDIPEMKVKFIDTVSGTKESGCFDMVNGSVISPHPNADSLQDGGKI